MKSIYDWNIWKVEVHVVMAAIHGVLVCLISFGIPLTLERVVAVQSLNTVFILMHHMIREKNKKRTRGKYDDN